MALPSDQNTGLQRASEETMSGYGSSSPLNYDDEPAQVDRHVQELEDALQDRRASRASAATPGRQEHEDGEVADGARTPARAQCYIRIGAHDVELSRTVGRLSAMVGIGRSHARELLLCHQRLPSSRVG